MRRREWTSPLTPPGDSELKQAQGLTCSRRPGAVWTRACCKRQSAERSQVQISLQTIQGQHAVNCKGFNIHRTCIIFSLRPCRNTLIIVPFRFQQKFSHDQYIEMCIRICWCGITLGCFNKWRLLYNVVLRANQVVTLEKSVVHTPHKGWPDYQDTADSG